MTSARQESDEKAHYDLFVRCLDASPMKLLRHGENPDFLVEREGRVIGIEHTELCKPKRSLGRRRNALTYNDPSELEGIQRRIVRDAQRLYVDQGKPPVSVQVWFATTMKHTRLATGRSKAIASELSRVVAEWVHANSPHLDGNLGPGDTISIDEIAMLSIVGGGSQWSKQGPSWIRPPSVSELQSRIGDKAARYDVYRETCDECWLLIVSDWTRPNQGFVVGLDDTSPEHCFRSKFERVFFLEAGNEILRELTLVLSDDTSR